MIAPKGFNNKNNKAMMLGMGFDNQDGTCQDYSR